MWPAKKKRGDGMKRGYWFLSFGLWACGPGVDPLPPADLAAICGEVGPFRVLELPPSERLAGPPLAASGRVLLPTGVFGAPRINDLPEEPTERAVWSIGPCGESPVRLAADRLVTLERWPGVVLGIRDEAREIVALDVTGQGGDHVVFPTYPFAWTDHGLVAIENDDVTLYPYPDDPALDTATARVLLEAVTSVDGPVARGDGVFALTGDRTLLRADLTDGTVAVEQDDVGRFAVSPDERWLVWQSYGDGSKGPTFVRDRSEGVDVSLGDLVVFPLFTFPSFADGLFVVWAEAHEVQRVYSLETLEFVTFEGGEGLLHVLADGRWAVGTVYDDGLDLYNPKDGSRTSVLDHGTVVEWGDELDVVDAPQCCLAYGVTFTTEGPMYRVSLTGEKRLLAERATRVGARLDDGRWLTGLDLEGDSLGPLVLVDPEVANSTVVDEQVFAFTAQPTSVFGDDDVVVYSVDDGERTGVWLANVGGT